MFLRSIYIDNQCKIVIVYYDRNFFITLAPGNCAGCRISFENYSPFLGPGSDVVVEWIYTDDVISGEAFQIFTVTGNS